MHRVGTSMWDNENGSRIRHIFRSVTNKEDCRNCVNYRTIALASHASKVILRIILMPLGSGVKGCGYTPGKNSKARRIPWKMRLSFLPVMIFKKKIKEKRLPFFPCQYF